MNEFITLKENARKAGKESFLYKNKLGVTTTYTKFVTKTGMVTYKKK
jgi:hypothetical protein